MATDSASASSAAPSRGLHIGLWVAQVLLAVAFLGSASMKLMTPAAELATKMAWASHVPEAGVKLIGVLELLGALGLILPSALRIQPKLTSAAAAGLVLTMIGAAATHIMIGEPQMTAPNFVLGGLAAFVAWGRLSKAPIAPKS